MPTSRLTAGSLGILLATLLFCLHQDAFISSMRRTPWAAAPATAAQSQAQRIEWQGERWYLHGINVPWYNWGCDFGCNELNGRTGGVSTNLPTLSAAFAQVKRAGMNVVRWWVFPGDPAQILRDETGAPIGLDPAVYADFDAALALAEQYDLTYNFLLFSAPTHIPLAWQEDPRQRAMLVDVLGTLFARYASHPRIFSWEPYNEPENDIWKWRIAQQPVVGTGTAIIERIHTDSPGTYATIGSFNASGMKLWRDANLDYYSPHWYDYMRGDNCMICFSAADYATWDIDKPIVVGEFYTATGDDSSQQSHYRYKYWYEQGYAGAWAWSLFHERTHDLMVTDLVASEAFAAPLGDLGPVSRSDQ